MICINPMNLKKLKSRRSIKRLGQKILWQGLVLAATGMLGVAITICLWTVDNPKSLGDLVASVTLSALLLILLLGTIAVILRKTKRTIFRWTRKSIHITIPLILLVLAVTVFLLGRLDESDIEFNSPEGLAGSQDYFEGLEFTTEKLWEATNEQRTKHSKSALTLSPQLNESALRKCQDMVAKNYWSHNDPDGREPWHFINQVNYSYDTAGENLAYGFASETDVVTGWMNSEGHRENLLGEYTEVGFGTCKSEDYIDNGKQLIVVQHFATPARTTQSQPSQSTSNNTPVIKPYMAPVCTKTPVPYEIKYIDVSYLYVGETEEYGGRDGYRETCTADSTGYKPPDFTSPPYDKTIYRGTKPKPSSSTNTPSLTYQQAYSNCNAILGQHGASNSSAMQQCLAAYGY